MRVLAFAAIVLSITGCSQGPATLTDYNAAYIRTSCDHEVACGQLDPAHRGDCVAFNEQYPFATPPLLLTDAQASLERGRIAYDPQAAQACLDGIASSACGAPLPDACRRAIRPLVPAGGACGIEGECMGGLSCQLQSSTDLCAMVCAPDPASPAAGEGQACGGADQVACAAGLVCVVDADRVHLVCKPPGGIGAPCASGLFDGASTCAPGLSCDYTAPVAVCVPKVGEGQPCGGTDACTDGLACRGVVVELTRDGATGVFTSRGQPGVCGKLSPDGGPCVALSSEPGCREYETCVDGVCRSTGALGDPCDPAQEMYCSVGYCDLQTMRCTRTHADGEPCTDDRECKVLSACDATTHTCRYHQTCR